MAQPVCGESMDDPAVQCRAVPCSAVQSSAEQCSLREAADLEVLFSSRKDERTSGDFPPPLSPTPAAKIGDGESCSQAAPQITCTNCLVESTLSLSTWR